MAKAMKRKTVLKRPIARRTLRTALVWDLRQKEQARRGNKVGAASKTTTKSATDVPITERAGHPLVPTKVKPQNWRTKEGKQVFVDLARVSWLPDDWGQGVKMTNPISRSRDGSGGTYTVWVGPEGHVFYHKFAIEHFLGRELGPLDGFNGQMRLARLQGKETKESEFFKILTAGERRHLISPDQFHFCIISARRTQSAEGLHGIAIVEAHFRKAGVQPTWYVDKDSLKEYRKLGLKAVYGGKLCEARNLALKDAARFGKVCVQCSDDILKWEYHHGEQAKEKSDEAANEAFAKSTCHVISPVTAARFILAKLRGSAPDPETGERPRLGGVYCLGTCSRTFCGEAFSRHHFILGDFFVADKSPVRFDNTMTLKEDYAFTCDHIEKHGSVVRCNRLTVQAKHQTNAGGACSIRDKKGREEQKNIAILKERWPRAFRDQRRQNEVTFHWPADGDARGVNQTSKPAKKDNASKPVKKDLANKPKKMGAAFQKAASKMLCIWKAKLAAEKWPKQKAPAGWPRNVYPDPSAWVSWLPEKWTPAMSLTNGAKLLRCYMSPDGQRYFHKVDVENALGKKLKARPRSEAPSRLSPVQAAEFPPESRVKMGESPVSQDYIKRRVKTITGMKVKDALTTKYKDTYGNDKTYGLADLRYDIDRGYVMLA